MSAENNITFWATLKHIRKCVKRNDLPGARNYVLGLYNELKDCEDRTARKRKDLLDTLVSTYKIDITDGILSSGFNPDLKDYTTSITPGISLVTCSRNRSENLLRALPSWLGCTEISEIIIVDWSSASPVSDTLKEHGIKDPRIKIVRVEAEERWILSYAYNVGFQVARFDKIIKVDADIVLNKAFFKNIHLENASYIAGNWRLAKKGQEFINGFFYISRADLMTVNGFNEYITTYGWDDDDLYDRLSRSGLRRENIDSEFIHHLPHDTETRMGKTDTAPATAWEDLGLGTKLEIQTNRFIAALMPVWNTKRNLQPFCIQKQQPDYISIKRNGLPPHVVPNHIKVSARYFAAYHMLSWRVGQRIFELDRESLNSLLLFKKTVKSISRLDIELAISAPEHLRQDASEYLVISFGPDIQDCPGPMLEKILGGIIADAKTRNLQLVFCVNKPEPTKDWLKAYCPNISQFPVVSAPCDPGKMQPLEASTFSKALARKSPHPRALRIEANNLEALEENFNPKAPQVNKARAKLYLDAQHGLGNRLRAIASGAVIAQKSDRELVVIWEPDHHCDCKLSDLFHYNGTVIEKTFLDDARSGGATIFNYMEIEKGAEKDARIILDPQKDAYIRSAYVLNSSLSNRRAENKFLQMLRPIDDVLNLMKNVRQDNTLGVHVRMEAGAGLDHNTYDSAENWTKEGHELLHYWRNKSHYSHFMKRIDQLISEGMTGGIFLAADRPEIFQEFAACYGDRVAFIQRDVFDRSKLQIQYALADILMLSSCQKLLGSTWSSFSELAVRMSNSFVTIEMSGKDF